MSQRVKALTLPFQRTVPNKPFQVVNVAACPECGSFVRRSRLVWWQRMLRKVVGRFSCGQCGMQFTRRA